MKIQIQIDDNEYHSKNYFSGIYALENLILDLTEKYFGIEIKQQFESILKSRLAEYEIIKRRK
jgi:hypothetical protein